MEKLTFSKTLKMLFTSLKQNILFQQFIKKSYKKKEKIKFSFFSSNFAAFSIYLIF